MGFSSLTRYDLFLESGRHIDSESAVRFENYELVKRMYLNSADLIKGFEDIINGGSEVPEKVDYLALYDQNAQNIRDLEFLEQVSGYIDKQSKDKNRLNPIDTPFKTYFSVLLKAISEYQKGIIETNFIGWPDVNAIREDRKQTFLSYAYSDKGLTQALFNYFWLRDGFLYVNWMWDGVNPNSSITKSKLELALEESSQLLFLRTTNSELRIRGNNNSIRQWCAWEIGNFYTKKREEKYYTSFYDRIQPRNDILDTFRPMREVVNGVIVP